MARQNEFDIKGILKDCKKAASTGYRLASRHSKSLNTTLLSARDRVQATVNEFMYSPCYDSESTELLFQQLIDTQRSFDDLSVSFMQDLATLKKNQSKFSITLFGRTMAGKSTLMEILTNGSGDSIGTGAQRTTRDVRKYKWNDLEITDVPGIGAFEGQEDEELAFEAAKSADLILFLITDDAPQAAEAECFGRIINLGKPVVCVVNVKASVSEGKSLKLALRDIRKKMDFERLGELKERFLSYGEKQGQEWRYIPFIYVHLKSAFIAQHQTEQEAADAYYEASRVEFLKKTIIEQVERKGQFYRIKTFIDAVSTPILNAEETLLNQSNMNSCQGRTILAKKRSLEQWKEKFQRDSEKQIKSLIITIRSSLYAEIAAFAEDHFDDENADKAWNKLIKDKGLAAKCQSLLENLERQTNDQIKEISREITNELKYVSVSANDRTLRMHKIIDGKKIWNWGALTVSGGLSIAASISFLVGGALAGPLGWAALATTGIGIIGAWFFKSRDKKEYEARRKLESALQKNVQALCDGLQKQMLKNLDSLIEARVTSLLQEMDRINAVIFKLADTQKELAWSLNANLLELNRQIVTEAIRLIGAEGLEWHLKEVARIPGNTVLIMLDDGKVFPKEQRDLLHRLMSEFIGFVYYSEDKKVLISRVLGRDIDRNLIRIEEKIGVAHVPLENASPNMLNRVRLAQEFSELLITNN